MVIAAVYVGVNLAADLLAILFTPRARTAIGS
jgi:peptide/nickel transport system permease protein